MSHHRAAQRVSAFAAAYTAAFGKRVAKGVLCSSRAKELPLAVEELLAGFGMDGEEQPQLKRRRLEYKQPPPHPKDDQSTDTWEDVLREASARAPRVGNFVFGDELRTRVQRLVPEFQVRVASGMSWN